MKKSDKYSTSRLLKWIWHASCGARIQILICALIGIISVACSLGFVYLSKNAIDIATGIRSGVLFHYATGMAALMIIEIALHATDNWIVNTLGVKTQNNLRARLFAQLMQSEWQGKDRHHSGDILNRLVQDLNAVVTAITSSLPFLVITAVQFVASFCFLYSMDRMLAIVLILILPFFALLSRLYVHRMRRMTSAIRESDSRIHSVMQESLQHKMVVKTLEQEAEMKHKLNLLHDRLHSEVIARTRFSLLSRSLVSTGFSAGYLTAFLWGVFRIQGGIISFGVMTAFLQLVGRIQRPLSDLARLIPTLVSALTATERLMELEELPSEDTNIPIKLDGTVGIQFNNVSFTYADGSDPVLSRLTTDFPPGSMTAILGETGVGKTTLIRLILALVKPTQGSILLYNDKQQIEASPHTRVNLVYVPQGNTLFSGTIRDNLLLGAPEATDEELWHALDMACADFVEQLPDKLDTLCSEQGGGLSEGQAQRIAIARSLLRPGSVLLLDEATSALDPDTEQHFLEKISAGQHGKTIIFITHRHSVLSYCDRVLRINDIKTNN